jgi:hypothetical protein
VHQKKNQIEISNAEDIAYRSINSERVSTCCRTGKALSWHRLDQEFVPPSRASFPPREFKALTYSRFSAGHAESYTARLKPYHRPCFPPRLPGSRDICLVSLLPAPAEQTALSRNDSQLKSLVSRAQWFSFIKKNGLLRQVEGSSRIRVMDGLKWGFPAPWIHCAIGGVRDGLSSIAVLYRRTDVMPKTCLTRA